MQQSVFRVPGAACVVLAWMGGFAFSQPVRVAVSVLPQAYLAERIGAGRVEVDVLVPPGQSPETYAVPARQMVRLSRAVVLFRIGVPFEASLLPKLRDATPNLEIVDTRAGLALRSMEDGHHHHDHGHADPGHHHDHGDPDGKDPHVWLSPLNAMVQAETICRTLCRIDPDHAPTYRRNLADLTRDLEAVHERLTTALEPVKGKTFMVFHPAFGYFADAYGLKQEPVEIEGKSPTARQLAAVIDRARKENVRVIFVQPQFSRKSAQVVARAIGGAVVPIDPLSRDYVANLEQIAAAISQGLSQQAGRGD